MHRGLLEAATQLGCKVHLDSRVVSIDPTEPSLVTKSGAKLGGDLIVASDGKYRPCSEAENFAKSTRFTFNGPGNRPRKTWPTSSNRTNGISSHSTGERTPGYSGIGGDMYGTEE